MNGFAIGLSGLNAATRRLDAVAFDVARAATQRTGQTSAVGAPGQAAAVTAAPAAAAAPAGGATPGGIPAVPAADVDLAGAMVDQIAASRAFMANLQTIRRTDEALGALLDLR
jgi:flagellar hook protein FlgE